MAVLDAVQTFAGIANENEFYSHHYLAEVFKGDIKARLDAWPTAEELNAAVNKAAIEHASTEACALHNAGSLLRGRVCNAP